MYHYGFSKQTTSIDWVIIHSSSISSMVDIEQTAVKLYDIRHNQTLTVKKSVHQYLGEPFGQCKHYGQSSQNHCYRSCVRNNFSKSFGCVPAFINNLSYETDVEDILNIEHSSKMCDIHMHTIDKVWRGFKKKCMSMCPKDCLSVHYSANVHISDTLYSGNDLWSSLPSDQRFGELRFVWDSTQPMIAYIEEPAIDWFDILVQIGLIVRLYVGLGGLYLLQVLIDKIAKIMSKDKVTPIVDVNCE